MTTPGPARCGSGRGRRAAPVPVRAAGHVHRAGAAEGDGGGGRRDLRQFPHRPDPRRLEVRGLDDLSAGVRLLPLIGGMMVGMIAGTRLQTGRINSKALGRARVRADGRRTRCRRLHDRAQRHRFRGRLVRCHRPRRRDRDAGGDERSTRRPVGGPQRRRLRGDHRDAPGRCHHRGDDSGHRPQLGLPQPSQPGWLAAAGNRTRRRRRRLGRWHRLRRCLARLRPGPGFASARRPERAPPSGSTRSG